MGPRGGADELVFAVDLVDKGSAGVTGADGGASDIGALDRVVDGLARPEGLASRDGDVFGIEPSEVSGSLTVWEDTIGLVLVVTESRGHERSSVGKSLSRRSNERDGLSEVVEGDWAGKSNDTEIVDDEGAVVTGVGDELCGGDSLAGSVVDVADLDGEVGRLLAVGSGVDEGRAQDGASAEVAGGLERRLPWDLAIDGELAANAEGGGRVDGLDAGGGGRSHSNNSRFEHHLEN